MTGSSLASSPGTGEGRFDVQIEDERHRSASHRKDVDMPLGIILIVGLTSFPMASMDACKKAADEVAGLCVDQNTGDVVKSKGVEQGLAGAKSLDAPKLRDLFKQELGKSLK
jgi:hypothetical protein